MAVSSPSPKVVQSITARIDARYIITTILAANAIGMLCARSLHYQFYAWLAWGTPFLLWRTGFHPVLQYLLWAVQEWAWNVYPSEYPPYLALHRIRCEMILTKIRHRCELEGRGGCPRHHGGRGLDGHATRLHESKRQHPSVEANAKDERPIADGKIQRLMYDDDF